MDWQAITAIVAAATGVILAIVKLTADALDVLRKGFANVVEANERHNADAERRWKKSRKRQKKFEEKVMKSFKLFVCRYAHAPKDAAGHASDNGTTSHAKRRHHGTPPPASEKPEN